MGERATIAELDAHVVLLCELHGILHDERDRTRARATHSASTGYRKIRVPQIRSARSYFVALHEIGHLVGAGGRSGPRLEKEAAAWRWALNEALIEPTPGVRNSIRRALRSYLTWAENRQHGAHGRPVIPPPDHDFWALLRDGR